MFANKNNSSFQSRHNHPYLLADIIQNSQNLQQQLNSPKLFYLFLNNTSHSKQAYINIEQSNQYKQHNQYNQQANSTIISSRKKNISLQIQQKGIFSQRTYKQKFYNHQQKESQCLPSLKSKKLQKEKEDLINFKHYEICKKNQRLKRKKLYHIQPISLFLQGQKKQRKLYQLKKQREENNSICLLQLAEKDQENDKNIKMKMKNKNKNKKSTNLDNNFESYDNLKKIVMKELNKRNNHLNVNENVNGNVNENLNQKLKFQLKLNDNDSKSNNFQKKNLCNDNYSTIKAIDMELEKKTSHIQRLQKVQKSIKNFKSTFIFSPKAEKFNPIQNKMSCNYPNIIKQNTFFSLELEQFDIKNNQKHKESLQKEKNKFQSQEEQSKIQISHNHNHNQLSMQKNIKTYKMIKDGQKMYKSNQEQISNKKLHIKNFKTIDKKQLRVNEKEKETSLVYLTQKQLKNIKCQSFIVAKITPITQRNNKPQQKQQRISNKVHTTYTYKIVTSNYSKKTTEIASLTKIMTFYTILKIGQLYKVKFNQTFIKIDQFAQNMTGTSAQILHGDIYTIQELFYGLMLPSGNDAAVALANWGGKMLIQKSNPVINSASIVNSQTQECDSESILKIFVLYMNKISKDIGLKSSIFANPHGLSNINNVSNAQDLALLVSKCIQQQIFLKVIGTRSYSIWVTNQNQQKTTKRQIIWQNTHKLLRRQHFLGGKTGVTVTAGPCLATIYKSPKTQQIFIIVLLRAHKLSRRFKQTRLILGWTLQKLDSQKYSEQIVKILKHDKVLDSDNSSDQEQFDFKRNDEQEFQKRGKILLYQM